jgi:DNA-binding NtrC family response regulator
VPVDVRLVSATHRDLEAMVEGGSFRADLFARLGGLEVHLPPLRERRQDLGMLTGALLRRLLPQGSAAIRFEPEAARALFAHDWPLNVRELEKCLGLALSLAQADGAPLALRQLPPALRRAVEELERPGGTGATRLSAEDESLRRQLEATLRQHQGNISAAARAMGRQRVQLHRWIKRYGLDPRSFRPK